eukprot:gi/632963066/ref/XP_007897674.1/ PREDICTED: CMRF35-like molecule 3 isoform X1 [Callorhinchus milii]
MDLTLFVFISCLSSAARAISGPKAVNGSVGSQVQIRCEYDTVYSTYSKYWCKGYYRRHCNVLAQTLGPQNTTEDGRITVEVDNNRGEFSVTMRKLTLSDAGWYWCGIEHPHILNMKHSVWLRVYEAGIETWNPTGEQQREGAATHYLTWNIIRWVFFAVLLCWGVWTIWQK